MSKTLILKANCNSEWDGVTFVLVPLSKSFTTVLKDAMKDAIALKEKYGYNFSHIRLFGGDHDWFNDYECKPMELVGDKDFVISDDDFGARNFTRPEQDIRYGQMKISEEAVQFVAYGKHTDEEFWTETITIKDLI